MDTVPINVTWYVHPERGTYFADKDSDLLKIVEAQFRHKKYYLKQVENYGRQFGVYRKPKWWWKFFAYYPREDKFIGYLLIRP